MSETQTEEQTHRETRSERSARRAAEQAAQNGEQGTGQATPDLTRLATLDPTSPDLSDEDRAAFDSLTEKQATEVINLRSERLAVEAVGMFATAEAGTDDLRTATQPQRNRKPVQKAMDKVAAKAYADWIEAGRPSTWSRMPVITYFIDPGTPDGQGSVADYRKWIRAAVQVVPAEPFEKDGKTIEPSGVRVRFGTDFVLTEKMAAKIHKPENAGKTVLAWAAIDKRNVSDRSTPDNPE